MTINFLSPEYYDVNDITDDMPNKELLTSLFERMNEQNERLWMFFTELSEDPQHKRMTAEAIKPRQHRKSFKKRQERARKARPIDDIKSDEFEAGYKAFLKEEFGDS
mgnify:FL=1|tara:strand:- start:767 stop:1087 length:321 start_codon:yes stop_codon:yes gene_type:complete